LQVLRCAQDFACGLRRPQYGSSSIPTRSTNLSNHLARANGQRQSVCFITRRSGACGKGFYRCALGFHADVARPFQHLAATAVPELLHPGTGMPSRVFRPEVPTARLRLRGGSKRHLSLECTGHVNSGTALTCPAIAMMVEPAAPLSARDVIAQCRRSLNRKPGTRPQRVRDSGGA
jgi:hypothetical protein